MPSLHGRSVNRLPKEKRPTGLFPQPYVSSGESTYAFLLALFSSRGHCVLQPFVAVPCTVVVCAHWLFVNIFLAARVLTPFVTWAIGRVVRVWCLLVELRRGCTYHELHSQLLRLHLPCPEVFCCTPITPVPHHCNNQPTARFHPMEFAMPL